MKFDTFSKLIANFATFKRLIDEICDFPLTNNKFRNFPKTNPHNSRFLHTRLTIVTVFFAPDWQNFRIFCDWSTKFAPYLCPIFYVFAFDRRNTHFFSPDLRNSQFSTNSAEICIFFRGELVKFTIFFLWQLTQFKFVPKPINEFFHFPAHW